MTMPSHGMELKMYELAHGEKLRLLLLHRSFYNIYIYGIILYP